jgi:hypothetical protein
MVRFPAGTRNFPLLHSVQTGSGCTVSPIQWVSGAVSRGSKLSRREAPLVTDVNAWSSTSISQYVYVNLISVLPLNFVVAQDALWDGKLPAVRASDSRGCAPRRLSGRRG